MDHTPSTTSESHLTLEQIRSQIAQAVIGQDRVIDELLICLIAGGHALLEGLPGLGKTLLCRSVAATFGGRFSRIQFTPDLMPADVTGHTIYNPKEGKFIIRRGPIFTNLLLADEINRAPAKTQAALLEVMQEGQVTLEGRSHPVGEPFLVVATQNPIELEGTYPLPEAQLDRFLMKIVVDYPSEEDEKALVARVSTGKAGEGLDFSSVGEIASAERILEAQQAAARVAVDQRVIDYAVDITRHSRTAPGVANGGSPRAALGMVRSARAAAYLDGRDFVVPDDIKRFAPAILRHRIKLTTDYEIEGRSADEVIAALLERVAAPRQ